MKEIFGQARQDQDSEWISISDLMSGLMLIFLFIAIVYIQQIVHQKNKAINEKVKLESVQKSIREIVVAWSKSQVDIYKALENEFGKDLPRWNAELDKSSLTIRFNSPEVLFDSNSAALKPEFKAIIEDFFPRYLHVLDHYKKFIDEVRIEGHTSSEWSAGTSLREAYFKNMALSQSRTRSVLEYALKLPAVENYQDWALKHVTANGMSSSHIIKNKEGLEDFVASRRVEFRIRTNAQEQIVKVVERLQ